MSFEDELRHWGIKGQKWGVRRYQNEDGTLTTAGRKRYTRDAEANAKKKSDKKLPDDAVKDPERWLREDRERGKRVAESGRQLTSDMSRLNQTTMDISKKNRKPMDLSHMTDQEMRNQINRVMLERQYNDMFNPQQVSRGRETFNDTMKVAGDVLAIGASALSIALAVRELRKGV